MKGHSFGGFRVDLQDEKAPGFQQAHKYPILERVDVLRGRKF